MYRQVTGPAAVCVLLLDIQHADQLA